MRVLYAAIAILLALPPLAEARRHNSRCVMRHPPAQDGRLISEFTTRFKAKNYGRAANVRLAAQSLDGVEIAPGALISYNRLVGPRSEEAGFELAPAIDRGKKVDKWGGGVCQPSSTLHAAALVGGMTLIERRPHTWQSKYIASGFDATVVWGKKDLVLQNPWPFPIRIAMEVGESHITARLLGDDVPRGWVDMRTRMVKQHEFKTEVEVDEDLQPDTMLIMITGLAGARVERERVFQLPGKPPRRQHLYDDVYYPRDALVRIGPPDT